MPYGTLNADKVVNSDSITSGGLYGFKNRIINGAMVIDQRNAGASVTVSTDNLKTLDRWNSRCEATLFNSYSVQQSSTAPTGFVNSLLVTSLSTASIGSAAFAAQEQRIEGLNMTDFGWGSASAVPIVVSFWVRSSLTGTFGGYIQNSAQNRAYVFTYTISSANTWEQKTITIAGDTSGTWLTTNGIGLRVGWNLGTGTTLSGTAGSWGSTNYYSATGSVNMLATNGATFYITGVQLEKGSTATSFDYRPYGTELMLCQRYYEKSYDQATAVGSASTSGYSSMNNPDQGTSVYVFNTDRFAVTKRASATMRFWDLAGNLSRITDYTLGGLARTDGRNSVYTYTGYQSSAVMINIQNASTAGTYQWEASAEL